MALSILKAPGQADVLPVLVLACCGELAWTASFAANPAAWAGVAAAHVLLTATVAAWAWQAHRRRKVRIAALLVIAIGLLGPFGAIGAALCLVIKARLKTSEVGLDEWYRSLFLTSEHAPAEDAYRQIVSGRDRTAEAARIEPFVEALTHGTVDQQLAAVALMSRRYRPAFAPAMLQALHAGVPAVRIQAASAIAAMEDRMNQRGLELDAAVRADPHSLEARLALARHHDDHAETGLLDGERARHIRARAADAYRACLELAPEDDRAAVELARILLDLGEAATAAALLERRLDAPHQPGPRRLLFAECLFRLNRLEELDELLATDPAPSAIAAGWTSQPRPEEVLP